MTGTVTTSFHSNEGALELPPSSRYAAIKDTIARWATGEATPQGCSAEELAARLVNDIVGPKKTGQVWRGPNSSSVRVIFQWLPGWVWVRKIAMHYLHAGIPPACLRGS